MGVPQKRERVFFICVRKDIAEPILEQKNLFETNYNMELNFKEKKINFGTFREQKGLVKTSSRSKLMLNNCIYGDKSINCINTRLFNKTSGFNAKICYDEKVLPTIDAHSEMYRFYDKLHLTNKDLQLAGSYPLDYNFNGIKPGYLIGMSVPPVMVANIATEIYKQILNKI